MNIAHDTKKDLWHESALYVYAYDANVEVTSQYDYCLWDHEFLISSDKTTVFGFMQSGIAESYYVNHAKATVETYTFEQNGIKYSVDYWYVLNLPEKTEYSNLNAYYIEQTK